VRDLHQHAAAVAGLRIGADGTAVVEVVQDLQRLLDDGVALAVLHVGDETDAAGVLLAARVVEALGFGQAGIDRGDRGRAHAAGRSRRRSALDEAACAHLTLLGSPLGRSSRVSCLGRPHVAPSSSPVMLHRIARKREGDVHRRSRRPIGAPDSGLSAIGQ
jgi:hypothetical protein